MIKKTFPLGSGVQGVPNGLKLPQWMAGLSWQYFPCEVKPACRGQISSGVLSAWPVLTVHPARPVIPPIPPPQPVVVIILGGIGLIFVCLMGWKA